MEFLQKFFFPKNLAAKKNQFRIIVFGLVLLSSSSQAALINANEFNKNQCLVEQTADSDPSCVGIDENNIRPYTPEVLLKIAKGEWVRIIKTFPGIDGDQGYYPAMFYMKSEDVNILFSKELGDNPDKDLKIIKMQDSDPVETVELHFFHEYFYKTVIKFRVGDNKQTGVSP